MTAEVYVVVNIYLYILCLHLLCLLETVRKTIVVPRFVRETFEKYATHHSTSSLSPSLDVSDKSGIS